MNLPAGETEAAETHISATPGASGATPEAPEPRRVEVHVIFPDDKVEPESDEQGPTPESIWMQVGKKISIWCVFGVILALIPIISNGVSEAFSASGYSFENVLQKGDLFIVSAVISGSTVGTLLELKLKKKERWGFARVIMSSVCFILSLLNSICYGPAANAGTSHHSTVFHLSLYLFLATLLTSGAGIALAVEE